MIRYVDIFTFSSFLFLKIILYWAFMVGDRSLFFSPFDILSNKLGKNDILFFLLGGIVYQG